MLPAETYVLSRDEIIDLIRSKCLRLGLNPTELLAAYQRGDRVDFGRVADIIGLAELLEEDDPIFSAA